MRFECTEFVNDSLFSFFTVLIWSMALINCSNVDIFFLFALSLYRVAPSAPSMYTQQTKFLNTSWWMVTLQLFISTLSLFKWLDLGYFSTYSYKFGTVSEWRGHPPASHDMLLICLIWNISGKIGTFRSLFVCLLTCSLRAETHLGPDGTRL